MRGGTVRGLSWVCVVARACVLSWVEILKLEVGGFQLQVLQTRPKDKKAFPTARPLHTVQCICVPSWPVPWATWHSAERTHAARVANHRARARARDGWRRGRHGCARLSARLPMEQAMKARKCTGRCGVGAPSEKLFCLSAVFVTPGAETRLPLALKSQPRTGHTRAQQHKPSSVP